VGCRGASKGWPSGAGQGALGVAGGAAGGWARGDRRGRGRTHRWGSSGGRGQGPRAPGGGPSRGPWEEGRRERGEGCEGKLTTGSMDGSNCSPGSTLGQGEGVGERRKRERVVCVVLL
jgi:hypothetical protein